MTNEEEYLLKRKLSEANYIINHIVIGFMNTNKIEEMTFERISPNEDNDMIKVFLPAYLERRANAFFKKK